MERHVWYLVEELVALAFFDSCVPSETKRVMKAAMEILVKDHSPKRPKLLDPASMALPDLITFRSNGFFTILGD